MCTANAQCNNGEGDCNSDDSCVGHLKCFQRSGNENVPGLTIPPGKSGVDFCYDPNWIAPGTVLGVYKSSGTQCVESSPCNVGEADCNNDKGCRGHLRCLQRSNRSPAVPGVTVPYTNPVNEDYCYDPNFANKYVAGFVTAKDLGDGVCSLTNPCDVGEGDCNVNSDCKTGLKCYQRTNG